VIYAKHENKSKAFTPELLRRRTKRWAFAHGLDCPVVGWSQRNERSFMMNHTDGWMSGWTSGGMWIGTVIGVLVVVLLVVVIIKLLKK
jgi:hypothetical protein